MSKNIGSSFWDTTDLMVHSPEPWLKLLGTHCHLGQTAEVLVKWGHDMRSEGLLRKGGMTAQLLAPDGTKKELIINEGGSEHYVIDFPVRQAGYYYVVVENRGSFVIDQENQYHEGTRREFPDAAHAIFNIQFGQAFIPVGHDLTTMPSQAGLQLEIAPTSWQGWRMGDVIALRALFRGQPLETFILDMAYQGPKGYKQWKETGEHGVVNFQPEAPGYYLAIARSEVQEKEDGVYDSLFLTATFPFIVRK